MKVNLSFIAVLLTKYYWLQRRELSLPEKPTSGGLNECLEILIVFYLITTLSKVRFGFNNLLIPYALFTAL